MTAHQMCSTCGYQVHAATIEDAWNQLDAHCDTKHGRRFRRGTLVTGAVPPARGRHATKPAPLTPQGGES